MVRRRCAIFLTASVTHHPWEVPVPAGKNPSFACIQPSLCPLSSVMKSSPENDTRIW